MTDRLATPSIRVVLVDDHGIVREGMRMILENDGSIEVVGEAHEVEQALSTIAEKKPNVILLDVTLGEVSSLDHMGRFIAAAPDARIVIVTGLSESKVAVRCAEEGAHGIVLKTQVGEDLLKALRKVHAGEMWFDRSVTADILRGRRREEITDVEKRINDLTSREREIVALVGKGLVNKDIADRIGINEKTVRNHLTTIYSKLYLTGRLPLALFAIQNDLV